MSKIKPNKDRGNKGNTYLSLVGQKGHVYFFHHADVLSTVELHVVEEIIRAIFWMKESTYALKTIIYKE